jgi:protease I
MEFDKARFKTADPLARVIVLTADKFEDFELFVPYFRLMEEGVAVDVAAPAKETITGENGYLFENVDLTIDEVDPGLYDLLFIPGGHPHGAPTTVRNNKHAQEIARAFFTADKPVAAICHGPYLLVSADLVAGRRLTSFWGDGVPEEIRAAGGIYVDEDVVVDGNLITSRWPMDLPAFMREVMRTLRLRGRPAAE